MANKTISSNPDPKKKNFTAELVSSFKCKDGKSQSIYWDGKTVGLGLRVTSNNSKSYIFETSLNNKTIRITIGDISIYSISQAREEAITLKAMTNKGLDPRIVRAEKIAENELKIKAEKDKKQQEQLRKEVESVTFRDAWQEYINDRRSAKEGKEYSWSERHYIDHVKMIHAGGVERKRSKKLTEAGPLASLASLKLVNVTVDEVAKWANEEAERRPTQARLAHRLLRAFFSWCNKHKVYGKIVRDNPAKNEDTRKRLGKPLVKNDVLQREQLAPWFTAVKEINNSIISAYLQTLLLTGRRREQIARLKWGDVDFKWNKITLKDKTEYYPSIPLTPYVASLIKSLPRNNEFVFSSKTSKSGYLTDPSDAHRKACVEAGIELTLHGLRRSFATLSEWIEVPKGIVAQIQGHAPQGVRELNYIRRPLDLLRVWHTKIEAWMLEQAKVNFKSEQSLVEDKNNEK